MSNTDAGEFILEKKKEKVIQTVALTCKYLKLEMPTINFEGCPMEKKSELAHYHPDLKKICISERQLKIQSSDQLEDTSIHEVIHHLGLDHDSQEEKVKFRQIKAYIKPNAWKPTDGASQFISADLVNEASRRIRQNPKELRRVNEDSDIVKFMEGRSIQSKSETHKSSINPSVNGKITLKNRAQRRRPKSAAMTRNEIEESREKLGIITNKEISNSSESVGSGSKEEKIKCSVNGCDNYATDICPYCKRYFCAEHIDPTIAMPHPSKWPNDNPNLLALYKNEWKKENVHVCMEYTKKMLADLGKGDENYRRSFDVFLSKAKERTGHQDKVHINGYLYRHMPGHAAKASTAWRAPNKPRKSGIDKAILFKAAAASIAIMILLNIGVLDASHGNLTIVNVASITFVYNLLAIFFIGLVYDYVTERRKFATQDLYGAIFSALLIMGYINIGGATIGVIAVSTVFIFVALYAGYWLANRKRLEKALQFFGILIVLVLFIELVMNPSGLNALTNSTGISSKLITGVLNATRSINSTLTQIANTYNPQINST